ncbi:MAG: polyprenyl synthetase [Bacteroidota bacterium]|nr:Octaprenyl diphosphate synthase [Flavobacteriales bacterium]WKZ75336.1 MAG: polyprenyl synthetase family protein [Vicingaceae bacterium]GIK70738.1 MAG: polyprenyl synthetase [Bacteroidota bacterium]
MGKLEQIKAPVAAQMDGFEDWFRQSMKSNVALLDKITHYIVKRKGKQIRPLFVFLSAKLHGQPGESSFTAASLIELLHTATLVHDDVVDDAHLRRGFFSVNALWKNKIAVLVGDYLLSKGLLLSVDKKEYRLLQIVSNSVREMSEGELLQIEKARRLDIKEPIYFEIIRQKTASLIASCCACGAASVSASDEVVEKMRLFGEYVGIAFQIKDDLFDYGSDVSIGKPTGIDIKEKKMTLPLIYALNQASSSEKRRIINTVKNHNQNPEKVKEVIQYVIKSGGIEYTRNKMLEYRNKAIELLHTFPQNEARNSLQDLVNFTVERVK